MDTLIDNQAQIALYNLKAKKKIRKIEESIDTFDKEIKESIEKCEELFNKYDAPTNYINELIEVENDIQNDNTSKRHSSSENLSAKKESILEEIKSFQSNLPLTAREDLSFLMKKINDRQKREDDNLQELKQIEELYPEARDYDVKTAYTLFPFSAIKLYLHPEDATNETTESEEESIITAAPHNMPYVVSIKKYSHEIEDEKESEAALEENLSTDTESDNTFFESGDNLTSAINNDLIAPEATKEEETSVLLAPEMNENSDVIAPIETSFDEVVSPLDSEKEQEIQKEIPEKSEKNEEAPEINKKNSEEEHEINKENSEEEPEINKENNEEEHESTETTNKIKYTLEEGLSLSDLALALCEDTEGWNDIFRLNKDKLEARMKENNVTDLTNIEDNTEIFKGLELTIPNEFTKEKIER